MTACQTSLKCVFHLALQQFAMKIDQVEDFLQNSQEFESPESLAALLNQHEHHTKGRKGCFFFYGDIFRI